MTTENSELKISFTTYRDYWEQKTLEELKKRTYVNPLYDAGFKAFLNDELALVSFLNGAFHLEGDKRITGVTVKNTEINIIFPETKTFNLDIRATTANGYCINVEMQKARPAHFADRVVLQHGAFTVLSKYEWDQGFEELPPNPTDKDRAERESRRYEIPPTYTIWVCDFKVARQDSYRGVWSVRNEKGLTLNDKVMYILYDLTQFTKSLDEIQTDEDRWLYLLKHAGTSDNLPDFGDEVIAKAIKRIMVVAASDELLKELANNMVVTEEELDHLAWLKVRAENEGLEKGLAKGLEQGIVKGIEQGLEQGIEQGIEQGRDLEKKEIAAAMLAEGDSVEKVMRVSKLSEAEVFAIKNGLKQ